MARQAPLGFQQPHQDRMASMENKLDKFLEVMSNKMGNQDENQKRMEAKFDQIAKNHASLIHNIEVQLGQLANAVASRNQGNIPSNTETNPREQLKAIKLRSGKEIKSGDELKKEVVEKQDKKTQNGDDDSTKIKEQQARNSEGNEKLPVLNS